MSQAFALVVVCPNVLFCFSFKIQFDVYLQDHMLSHIL